jgi:uncharacterized protein with FMN-binding domain
MSSQQTPHSSSTALKVIGTLIAVGIIGIVANELLNNNSSSYTSKNQAIPPATVTVQPVPADTTPAPVTTPPVKTPPAPTPATKYKNGIYSQTASYYAPSGQESFGLSVTIKNDKVVAATFTPMAHNRTSQRYQDSFNQGFSQQVVGMSLDSISLDVVNGASLTTQGFNDALAHLKTKASA